MRLFITGISGLLGLNAALALRDRAEVSGCTLEHPVAIPGVRTSRVDVADDLALAAALAEARPHLVLNTVGMSSVDACELSPARAARVNVQTAREVARAARKAGARLVHVSTDHVFDGTRAERTEDDTPIPVNEYARTKLEAERVVLAEDPDALVVRTNFYGWGTGVRTSLSDWVLQGLTAGRTLPMFTDVYFTPLLANDLAELVVELAAKGASGVLHVAGGTRLSKHAFGIALAEAFGRDASLIRPASLTDVGLVARRPADMSLSSARTEAWLGRRMPSAADGLARLRDLERSGWPGRLATAIGRGTASTSSAHPRAAHLALVVPTKDRPREVRRVLASVSAQSVWPARVVVVDAGDGSLAPVAEEFAALDVQYVRAHRPGLTRQKNMGLERVGDGVDLIGFIDDDIVFEPGAIDAMVAFWRDAPRDVGGASFNIVNTSPLRSRVVGRLLRIFRMSGDAYGTVLRSGFNTPITNTPTTRFTEWLNGGSTVWRREVFREHRFGEWFPGSGLCEDVWFSRRVHPGHRMAVVAEARVRHEEVPHTTRGDFGQGRAQVLNRLYVVRSDARLSLPQCLWALTGQLLINAGLGLVMRDRGLLLRAAGNLAGFARVVRGGAFRVS